MQPTDQAPSWDDRRSEPWPPRADTATNSGHASSAATLSLERGVVPAAERIEAVPKAVAVAPLPPEGEAMARVDAPKLDPAALAAAAQSGALRLDMESAPAEVTPSPSAVAPGGLAVDTDGSARSAAAFHPRSAAGQEQRRRVLRSIDESMRRESRRERREATLVGAFLFLVIVVAFPATSTLFMLTAAAIGAGVGFVAQRLGDRSESWLVSTMVGVAALAPLAGGPLYLVLAVLLAGAGWTTGRLRS